MTSRTKPNRRIQRSTDGQLLELGLIAIVFGIAAISYMVPASRTVILYLYFLPVAVGGFFLGRYRAGVLALLCTVLVVLVTVVKFHEFSAGTSPAVVALTTAVWGAVLGLTTLFIGTESDELKGKLTALRQSHKTDVLLDALTGVANRRALQYELNRRMTEWNRCKTPLSLVLVDIDRFKNFNDTYGHQTGDEVLRGVAHAIQANVREVDLVARYGGEEFAVVLPSTGVAKAKETAERVRNAVENTCFETDGLKLRLTVSAGLAQVKSQEDVTLLVHRADEALYTSKQAGRNCVHFHDGQSCRHFGASLTSPPPQGDSSGVENTCDVYTDGITGLPSRKVFNEDLRRRVSEAQRYEMRLSIMIVHIDDFTAITEQGRKAGDMALTMTAEFIRSGLREADLAARYAKDEFAVLLPATPLGDASIPAERIRRSAAEYQEMTYQGTQLCITLSVGVAQLLPEESAAAVLQRADTAVENAAVNGGNQTFAHCNGQCEPLSCEALA